MIELDLAKVAKNIEVLAAAGSEETGQETFLSMMESTWDQVEFCALLHQETGTPLLKMNEEDLEVGGESKLIFFF